MEDAAAIARVAQRMGQHQLRIPLVIESIVAAYWTPSDRVSFLLNFDVRDSRSVVTPENRSSLYISTHGVVWSCTLGSVIPFKPKSRGRQPPPPASAATRPNKPESRPENASLVYRAVEGWPIHWREGNGVVHACEVSEVHPGCMLAWTICGKDVYDDATYVSRDLNEVTCSVCAKERWIPRDPNGPEPAWVPDYKPGNDNG